MTTKNQLRTFEAPQLGDLKFTVWDREGEPWFIAKEVLDVLGLDTKTVKQMLVTLDVTEKLKENINTLCSAQAKIKGYPLRWFISESGLYKLIMRSNKPEAQQFQDWVTKVVLPAIRKDGAYIEGEEKLASGEMSEDEFVLKAMQILQSKVERLTVENQKMTQELTLLTLAEYIALNHKYVSRHNKSRIAFAAVDLASRRGIKLEKQDREIPSLLSGVVRKVNVYPRDLLDEVVKDLGIFEPAALY